ncbi:uncharacterized protein LOC141631245 [Silene latifolia]|uniref:uncharacterized protein LOC141631245 n=1 Tax=Silene latifolia TaxID=37657 RepID=UPI003D770F98
MLFGLMNAPAIFMDQMNRTISKYLDKYDMVFIDDILIYSRDEAEHESHLRVILETLRKQKWYCTYEFVVMLFGLMNAPAIFMDQMNRTISKYLDKCDMQLKKRFTTAPVLTLPKDSFEFDVYCDASKFGLGCVLMQKGKWYKRWLELLNEYKVELQYHEGKSNIIANALSLKMLEDMLRACALEFQVSWENSLPLVEFSYNNSYQPSIQIAPFELCRYRSDPSYVQQADVIEVDPNLTYEERPIRILERQEKRFALSHPSKIGEVMISCIGFS